MRSRWGYTWAEGGIKYRHERGRREIFKQDRAHEGDQRLKIAEIFLGWNEVNRKISGAKSSLRGNMVKEIRMIKLQTAHGLGGRYPASKAKRMLMINSRDENVW